MEQSELYDCVKKPHPKLIYFAARHPRFSPVEFIERWRQHANLGMSMPRWRNIKRYVHCDRISGPSLDGEEILCDGVAMVWYHSESTRQAHIADTSAAPILKSDELETFDRPVQHVAVLTEETICIPSNEKPFSLFLRVCRFPAQPYDDFLIRLEQDFVHPMTEKLRASGNGFTYNAQYRGTESKNNYCDCVMEFQTENPSELADEVKCMIDKNHGLAQISFVWTRPIVLHNA